MKAFDKVNNRQCEGNAAWYLFQLIVFKSKKIRDDLKHIRVGKNSVARKTLGWCKYDWRTQIATVSLSPWCALDYWRIHSAEDLYQQVYHTAVHEICHGLTFRKYADHNANKITVQPHGSEWQYFMRKFGIYDAKASGRFEFPKQFVGTEFERDSKVLFQDWRNGESLDKELFNLCLESNI